MGVFSVRVSHGCADADFGRRPFFCLDRLRPIAINDVILALGIILTAAAIAACFTVMTEWMHTAYFKSSVRLKTEIRSGLGRDSEAAQATVATTIPAVTAFLLDSPFAHWSGLLYRPEPVGSDSLRHGLTSGSTTAERPSVGFVVATLLPVSAPSDAHPINVPLPPLRPIAREDMQGKSDTVASVGVAISPKALAVTSPTAPSASLTFLQKFFHYWQANNDIKFPPEADAHTAVYDIEAHVVYLPNGEQLEAHSGMGALLDNARYVKEKGRGPTPPNVYHLAMRESLFHGVQAIRLNPVDGGKMYGRAGMLAHPYMLGPDGQSNGCVSVQDYSRFLEAFLRGEIDRLIVVPKLAGTYAANTPARDDKQYALQ